MPVLTDHRVFCERTFTDDELRTLLKRPDLWVGPGHDLPFAVCKHGETYGTRCATLIALPEHQGPLFRFAPGPPCETAFETIPLPFGGIPA